MHMEKSRWGWAERRFLLGHREQAGKLAGSRAVTVPELCPTKFLWGALDVDRLGRGRGHGQEGRWIMGHYRGRNWLGWEQGDWSLKAQL